MKHASRIAAILTRLRRHKMAVTPQGCTSHGEEVRRYDVGQITEMIREARGGLQAVEEEIRSLRLENKKLKEELDLKRTEIDLLLVQLWGKK